MARYFRSQETRDLEVHKSEICDHQEKDYEHGKPGENPKFQQMKHHRQNQGHLHHHYQHKSHQSDDNDSHGTHSTVEGSIFHNRQHDNHHQRDSDRMDHSHSHHCPCKQNHDSVSGSSSTSSSLSPSSSSYSSTSSSSYSSSFSASSSSLSSDTSSECFERCPLGKPQHSQSCNDISRKQKFFDEEDDTTPLIDDECHLYKERRETAKYCHGVPLKNTRGIASGSGKDESFRKAKSMESLSRPKEREWHENEVERRKNEGRKNFLKEKLKFSAFLNEITRQVLSPMRLTSLGVTDTHRKPSPGQASVRSSKIDSSTEKFKQQRRRNCSADSDDSSRYSHTSGRPSHSKSLHHHPRNHTPAPNSSCYVYDRPQNCTDIKGSKRRHTRSLTSQRCPHSPCKHHHHQGDDCSSKHHKNCEDCISPSHCHQHRDHHKISHHHDHGHSYSPGYHHGDHHSPNNHSGAQHNTPHHHHHGDHHGDNHNQTHHHGEPHSTTHHQHHRDHHGHTHHRESHHSPTHHNADSHSLTHDHKDYHDKDRHHGDHHISDHQNHQRGQTHRHEDHHHNTAQQHHYGDHHRAGLQHRHGGHQHHHADHQSEIPQHHHGDQHSPSLQHRHGDHQSPGHQHNHGDDRNPDHYHEHGNQHNPSHQHHLRDHHSIGHQHHHRDHHSPGRHHDHSAHHSEIHQHHHGDHHNPAHQHRHGNHHSPSHHHQHEDHRSPCQQHHYGDHHNSTEHHHHGDHQCSAHWHHHGDHHSTSHHHDDQSVSHFIQSQSHNMAHSDVEKHSGNSGSLQYRQPDPHHHHISSLDSHHLSPLSDSEHSSVHHGHHSPPRHVSEYCNHPVLHLNNHHSHSKGHSHGRLTLDRKLETFPSKPGSSRNTSSPSSQDEEQSSYTGSSLHKEKPHKQGRKMMLQEQNEGLHQSLQKTAVRMECLGEEFMNSQQLLEVELQKTCIELSNLTESFARLQNNCSSTQQADNIPEQKLHAVGTSVSRKPDHHFQSGDAINQVVLPITPPPTQFVDSHNFGKANAAGREQPLRSVPEEEESDWSEMGEETPKFMLPGSNRDHGWRHTEGEGDIAGESEDEEVVRRRPACSLQIPHLQFTIHNQPLQVCQTNTSPCYLKNPSDGMTGKNPYIAAGPKIGSTILIRSASLEEIPLACHHMQKELIMDRHHSGDVEAVEESDNEIIHHWTASSGRDAAMRRLMESGTPEADSSLTSLQSAEQMLNHFLCQRQPSEEPGQGWAAGLPEEELNVESTQL